MISPSISIIDQDRTFSSIISSLLSKNENPCYQITGIHSHVNDLSGLKNERPDFVLLEISFLGSAFEEVIVLLKKIVPASQLIILTSEARQDIIIRCLKAGADGYVLKTLDFHSIITALNTTQHGGVPLSRVAAKAVIEVFRPNSKSILTRREGEIMNLVSHCKSYSEISEQLNIGKHTARTHIRNIYKKLHVNKKSEAIRIARREKIIVA